MGRNADKENKWCFMVICGLNVRLPSFEGTVKDYLVTAPAGSGEAPAPTSARPRTVHSHARRRAYIHAKNKIEGIIIPSIVPGFWDKKHHDVRRRHATSPVFSGHYQDLGISSFKMHDSAYLQFHS